MAIDFSSEQDDPWPLKLQQTQNLRVSRGDVLVIDRTLYVVIGFDGRNEGYLCWKSDAFGDFDTSRYVLLLRFKAHNAPRDLSSRQRLPPLPAIDHTGRILGGVTGKSEGGSTTRSRGTHTLRPTRFATVPFVPSRITPVPLTPPGEKKMSWSESPGCTSPGGWSSAPAELQADGLDWPVDLARGSGPLSSEDLAKDMAKELLHLPGELPRRQCILCSMWHAFVAALPDGFWRTCATLRGATSRQWAAMQQYQFGSPLVAEEEQPVCVERCDVEPSTALPPRHADGLVQVMRPSRATHRDAFEDFQITIPIVRPPGWQEVQPLLQGKAVTFDERGLKETMTVKTSRWCDFVDRQKARIEKELAEVREAASRRISMSEVWCDGDGSQTPSETSQVFRGGRQVSAEMSDVGVGDEDISELEQMVERMNDWKDLSQYSGKSISMASTRRGNEMKIHVMAFAEREDGSGVDFMRLSYRKSVEVRERRGVPMPALAGTPGLGHTLRMIVPFRGVSAADWERTMAQWVQLLQRPDLAKFTIALAFRNALESDGIHLKFCEAPLDELGTLDRDWR